MRLNGEVTSGSLKDNDRTPSLRGDQSNGYVPLRKDYESVETPSVVLNGAENTYTIRISGSSDMQKPSTIARANDC